MDGEAPGRPDEGDAVEHLWNAAHEMLRAMRMLVDAADEFVASQRDGRGGGAADREHERETEGREGRVRHIDIDVRAENGSEPAAGADTPGAF